MKMIIYECFKDDYHPSKPFCVSTEKGYFSFYTKEEMNKFIKEVE